METHGPIIEVSMFDHPFTHDGRVLMPGVIADFGQERLYRFARAFEHLGKVARILNQQTANTEFCVTLSCA